MAVVITTSTLGGYQVFSSTNATVATTFTEVINELETHNISLNQTRFTLGFDSSGNTYTFAAICRRG